MHLLSRETIVLISLLLCTTTAQPTYQQNKHRRPQKPQRTDCPLKPPPSLPQSTLPAVTTGLTLKHIVLGHGTQNYNCPNSTATPVAQGAVATLYDVSCLMTAPDSRSKLETDLIPSFLQVADPDVSAFVTENLPGTEAGSHYFRDPTTPVFELNDGSFIAAAKVAGCPAPATATPNQYGTAVDWLKLARKPDEPCGGIQEVYRVETAGGRSAPICTHPGQVKVPYATLYWMFG